MRARDLVALGADGDRYGLRLPSRQRTDAVREMLHAVDADRFADARVGNLSGGEQQRVLIAQALISRPRLLLLDEPLANLDPAAIERVAPLIGPVSDPARPRTRVLTSHDPARGLAEADLVLGLREGRAELLAPGGELDPETVGALYR
jgi:zinc/manganese transport system ATP-binding protein